MSTFASRAARPKTPRLVEVVFPDNGSLMATIHDYEERMRPTDGYVWNARTRRFVGKPFGSVNTFLREPMLEFSSDGSLLVNSASVPELCDATTRPLKSHAIKEHFAGDAAQVRISADGRLLAVYWDKTTKQSVRLSTPGRARPASTRFEADLGSHPRLAFSPDGQILAAGRNGYGKATGILLFSTTSDRPRLLPVPSRSRSTV